MTRKMKGMTAIALAGGLALVAGGGIPTVMLYSGSPGYSEIPPKESDVHSALSSAEMSIGEAIEVALASVDNGQVSGAKALTGNDNTSVNSYEVLIYTPEQLKRVFVDASSGEVTETQDVARFPGDPVEGEWTETESGLKYYDIVEGNGATPSSADATVTVHYSGWLVDGTQFDSSRRQGKPVSFQLNSVIPGWREGVQGMSVGGKRKLILPGSLAYGNRPPTPAIPFNAVLIFDVELLGVEE